MNIQAHCSFGNKKLPKSTIIFNCGSATDCPSRKLGLCQAGDDCYALKAERQYPPVLPYRRRQRQILTDYPGSLIGSEFARKILRRRTPTTIFRFNEAGDFESQSDVDKMTDICEYMHTIDVKCMGYTARTDLDLRHLACMSSLCVSNDLNDWRNKGCIRFKVVDEPSKDLLKCKGDCRKCNLCLRAKGMTIQVKRH